MLRTFKQLKFDITKVIQKINEKHYQERIAKRAIEIIYKRVKSGYGASGGEFLGNAEKKKLKPLSESYKQQRSGKVAFFTNKNTGQVFSTKDKAWTLRYDLGQFGSPNRSNLTLSGQLLESMTFKTGKDITLFIPNTLRKKIRSTDSAPITNKKVAEYVERERPFFAITAGEYRILEREIDLIIKEIVRSLQL